MAKYIANRFWQVIIGLLVLITIVFFLIRLTGDPVAIMMPLGARPEDMEQVRHSLGLDKPLAVQYVVYISNLARGDLGVSIRTGRDVTGMVKDALPPSLRLMLATMLFSLLVGLSLGVVSALKRGGIGDTVARVTSVIGRSAPSFLVGFILVELFAVRIRLLPASGESGPASYIMPVIAIGLAVAAPIMRLVRSGMLEVLDSDYVRMARSKGLSERVVIWKHALGNALLPVVHMSAVNVAGLITGLVVIEAVFRWPGIGQLAYVGLTARDFPVVLGVFLIAAAITAATNLLADIVAAVVDPRG